MRLDIWEKNYNIDFFNPFWEINIREGTFNNSDTF